MVVVTYAPAAYEWNDRLVGKGLEKFFKIMEDHGAVEVQLPFCCLFILYFRQ
jgi:hypothetical protein